MGNYKVIFKPVELNPRIPEMTSEQIAVDFTQGLQKTIDDVENGMKNFPGGGDWEIIDHHMLRMDRHLLISVLVKKI